MSRALRLRLYVEDDTLRLRSANRVDMHIAPSDRTETSGGSGFWVELRDQGDRTLYRRILADVLQDSVEVYSDDPSGTIVRHTLHPAQTEFVVIVPDAEEGSSAVFFGTSYSRGQA